MPLRMHIETIPHESQRYPTVGDYWLDESGVEQIRVSEMMDWRYEVLVAVHEIIEMALTRQRGMSTILITHDLGLAAAYCDRVMVMEKGRVVEAAKSREIFTASAHPYTRKLMRATPRPNISLRDLLPADEPAHSPSPCGKGLGAGLGFTTTGGGGLATTSTSLRHSG